jgi:hypothetical protein
MANPETGGEGGKERRPHPSGFARKIFAGPARPNERKEK